MIGYSKIPVPARGMNGDRWSDGAVKPRDLQLEAKNLVEKGVHSNFTEYRIGSKVLQLFRSAIR